MPVTPSAKKALRNANARFASNALVRADLKRTLKNATPETVSQASSPVNKAAKRAIIHPNKAARIKSRLAKLAAGTAPVKALKKTARRRTVKPKVKATKKK